MKAIKFFAIFFVIFSCFSQAQKFSGDLLGVLELKHSSKIDFDARDNKTLELNSIFRFMPYKHLGFTCVVRMNDTSANFLAGMGFIPAEWFRLDILGGISIPSQKNFDEEKKSLLGLRLWAGNDLQDFWLNLDGGTAAPWFEIIYIFKINQWFYLGAMADKNGLGPRIEITPFCNMKVWGSFTSWYHNKNRYQGTPGYNPENAFGHVGIKILFL